MSHARGAPPTDLFLRGDGGGWDRWLASCLSKTSARRRQQIDVHQHQNALQSSWLGHTALTRVRPGGGRFCCVCVASRPLAVCCASRDLSRIRDASAFGLGWLEAGPGAQKSVEPECAACPLVLHLGGRCCVFFAGIHNMGDDRKMLKSAMGKPLPLDAVWQDFGLQCRRSGHPGGTWMQTVAEVQD